MILNQKQHASQQYSTIRFCKFSLRFLKLYEMFTEKVLPNMKDYSSVHMHHVIF